MANTDLLGLEDVAVDEAELGVVGEVRKALLVRRIHRRVHHVLNGLVVKHLPRPLGVQHLCRTVVCASRW